MVILMEMAVTTKDEPYETDLFKLFMRISESGVGV